MITRIDTLVRNETRKAIRAILESSLSDQSSDEEKKRQQRQQQATQKRDLQASESKPSVKDEAEEEDRERPKSDDKKREDRTKGKGTADSPKLKTPKAGQLKNPDVNLVIDKLNALRGGKSLKDPEVRKSFEQYFNSLTVQEKQTLVLFMTGIAQVLAGSEVGAEAIDPGDVGLRVKDTGKEKKVLDNEKDKEADKESGTEENPIVVGEAAYKTGIMRALRAYRENS